MSCIDSSSLMDTGYSILMDSRSAVNAKKLFASADFQVHIQPIVGLSSSALEPQATVAVMMHFIFIYFVVEQELVRVVEIENKIIIYFC